MACLGGLETTVIRKTDTRVRLMSLNPSLSTCCVTGEITEPFKNSVSKSIKWELIVVANRVVLKLKKKN